MAHHLSTAFALRKPVGTVALSKHDDHACMLSAPLSVRLWLRVVLVYVCMYVCLCALCKRILVYVYTCVYVCARGFSGNGAYMLIHVCWCVCWCMNVLVVHLVHSVFPRPDALHICIYTCICVGTCAQLCM